MKRIMPCVVMVLLIALSIWLIPHQTMACTGNCRVTGGGNISSGIEITGGWDGTLAESKYRKGPGGFNKYTFGGQAGANSALEPQGEWTHHQLSGPDGSFVFHGYIITDILCFDPDACNPAAANGLFKQIDFTGIGTINNAKDTNFEPKSAHYFEVHIEDLGEPGNKLRGVDLNALSCPPAGSGTDMFAGIFKYADCGCKDFYRIRIYEDETPTTVVYEVYGYLSGGNFQIHQLTGFDMK